MTGSRGSRFELQVTSHHGMMERRVDVYRLTINVFIILPSCGIALKLIGSATRYEFQGLYHNSIINGRQQVYL